MGTPPAQEGAPLLKKRLKKRKALQAAASDTLDSTDAAPAKKQKVDPESPKPTENGQKVAPTSGDAADGQLSRKALKKKRKKEREKKKKEQLREKRQNMLDKDMGFAMSQDQKKKLDSRQKNQVVSSEQTLSKRMKKRLNWNKKHPKPEKPEPSKDENGASDRQKTSDRGEGKGSSEKKSKFRFEKSAASRGQDKRIREKNLEGADDDSMSDDVGYYYEECEQGKRAVRFQISHGENYMGRRATKAAGKGGKAQGKGEKRKHGLNTHVTKRDKAEKREAKKNEKRESGKGGGKGKGRKGGGKGKGGKGGGGKKKIKKGR